MKGYLRKEYEYEICSTNLAIHINAFDQKESDGPKAAAAIALKNKLFAQSRPKQ